MAVGYHVVTSVILVTIVLIDPIRSSSRPTKEKLNVHFVPHSHDDVGWQFTVEEYYNNSVKAIITSVVSELLENRDRKFIQVEMAYFYRWWSEQSQVTQEQVMELVSNGQLEFTNGGWCMNDEGASHYNGIIDQMSLGLRFIEHTFGPQARPRAAWHIDPFGHSATQATLFAKMGFDGVFFGRIDYYDKANRLSNHTMEMVWQANRSLKDKSNLFTGVLYQSYKAPSGFCFDITCGDPEIDDGNSSSNNVDQRVSDFLTYAEGQAAVYKTNNILVTMGGDFLYTVASKWYRNLDKLIHYLNEDGTVNAFYSTPAMYLDYLHKANETWSLKTDDFLPYSDQPWSYWTGYFTSRPNFKGYVRKMNNLLQACKQVEALHNRLVSNSSLSLQRAMAVAQHHDAITGTHKAKVGDDYIRHLYAGQTECVYLMEEALGQLVTNSTGLNLEYCEYLNISVCNASETSSFDLVVYNSLARNWTGVLRVPINTTSVTVTGPTGSVIPTQIIPVSQATMNVRRNKGNATYELLFGVYEENAIPPLGYSTFFIRGSRDRSQTRNRASQQGNISISNEFTAVSFDGVSGHIATLTNIPLGLSLKLDQQFLWYQSQTDQDSTTNPHTQASGAYIFRPNETVPFSRPVNKGNQAKILAVYKGVWVEEVHQSFADWITQVVRVYKGIPGVELEYTVGPIPIADGLGKEIISQFTSNISSNQVWYTDSNGREMQWRKRDYRQTWSWDDIYANKSSNYYPVNSRIYLRDERIGMQFTVLNDRSQGGSSLNDGQIELMVHRRCLFDDHHGVNEPLNETGQYGEGLITRGKHHILFDNVQNSTYWHRLLAERMMLEPVLMFSHSRTTVQDSLATLRTMHQGILQELPDNIHLLTVEHLEDSMMLLRLENQYQADEPAVNGLDAMAIIDIDGIFKGLQIRNLTELTLGGNAAFGSFNPMKWNTEPASASHLQEDPSTSKGMVNPTQNMTISLQPMDIRTFNVIYDYI